MADKPRGLQVAAYRYNCQPCKQRKTKCDRVKPCASCHLRGTQDKCYIDDHDGADSPSSEMATEQERPPKKPRISNPKPSTKATTASTSPVKQSRPSTSAFVSPSSHQQDSTTTVQDHIAMLRKTIDQLEASILPSPATQKHSTSSLSSSHYYDSAASPSSMILTTNTRLVWAEVAHLFPPQRDVERILEYFLRELVYIMVPVQEKQFWRAWLRLTSPALPNASAYAEADSELYQPGISRSMVASLLICLASTSFMIPQRREEELELTRGMAEQRDQWITCALALARSGASFGDAQGELQPWLHYVDATTDTSLDRFGFETLAVRIFALLGMSEMAYHLNGECLRRAIRINLFDESSLKAAEAFTVEDPELTDEEVLQMRRRIGYQMAVTERWTCLYTGRIPMIDEEAETLPVPSPGWWKESEELAYHFSRFVSKLRLLPAQLTALTTRKPGDWSTQRTRDQEAVQRILDIDRGLCAIYDPAAPRTSMGGRSHASILADLPEILERNQHLDTSDKHINQLHREFADALIMTSSWLSLRCLATSNLMFLPWVPDVASRYYALNLARRLIELLPSIWMMASSPYVPFSSSWISRHVFLACTVLSVPILGQEPGASSASSRDPQPGGGREEAVEDGERGGDFAPSRLQSKHFFGKLSSSNPLLKLDGNNTAQRLPASSSIDLDWFSSKLVEIASLFSKLAERGDQTAGVNTKLIHALLNGRAELRDRVLDKLGQKQKSGLAPVPTEGMGGRFESQRDLTTFVMASSVGKGSPSSAGTSPATQTGAGSSPVNTARGRRWEGVVPGRERSAEGGRVSSPSLHDLANAVDYTSAGNRNGRPVTAYGQQAATAATPPLPSFSPQPPQQQESLRSTTAPGGAGIGWDWDKAVFPPTPASTAGAGGGDVLASVPMLLDTQDWLAILDGVDIPL